MSDDPLVRFADSKGLGLCADGQRRFFAAHGLDFREYVRHGIPESALLETGDVNAERLVRNARLRRARGE